MKGIVAMEFPSFLNLTDFEELAYQVKSLLSSQRKGDPKCRTVMSFDTVSFDSLIVRSSVIPMQ